MHYLSIHSVSCVDNTIDNTHVTYVSGTLTMMDTVFPDLVILLCIPTLRRMTASLDIAFQKRRVHFATTACEAKYKNAYKASMEMFCKINMTHMQMQ